MSAYTLQRQPATQFRQLSPDADITIDATSVPTATGASVGGLTQPAGLNGDLARYQTGHSGFESESVFTRSRLSDPVRHIGLNHNMSITDADKLERRGHDYTAGGGGTYNGCSVQSSFGLDRHSFDDELHHAMGTSGRGSGYTSDFTSTYRQLTAPHGDSDQNRMSALSGNHWMETQNHYSMQV